jgi:hypothetical protein
MAAARASPTMAKQASANLSTSWLFRSFSEEMPMDRSADPQFGPALRCSSPASFRRAPLGLDSEEQLNLRHHNRVLLALDASGKVLTANSHALRLFGCEVGSRAADVLRPKPRPVPHPPPNQG